MGTVRLYDLGTAGIITDKPSHTLPPEVWSDARNVVFENGQLQLRKGETAVFETPTVVPGFLMNVPALVQTFWLYANLTKVYVYDSGVHTNITRQTAGVDVNYTATAFRQWGGTILGGIPILNNGLDQPQYWGTLSSGTKLTNLSSHAGAGAGHEWPSAARARVMRAFGPFLVAMNFTESGATRGQAIWWSHPAEPGTLPQSWDYTDPTYDSGQRELTDVKGGQILDALALGNTMPIYKENATHVLRFVGGQEIFVTDLKLATSGILATRTLCPIKEGTGHFVVTGDDIILFDGQSAQSVVEDRFKKQLFSSIDATNYANSFCFHDSDRKEAYFCYPEAGATYPNLAVVWNYEYNTITKRDWVGVSVDTGGVTSASAVWSAVSTAFDLYSEVWSRETRRQLVVGDQANTRFFSLNSSNTSYLTSSAAYIERTGLAIVGKDRQGKPKVDFGVLKLVTRIWPKITGTGVVTVRIGAQDDLQSAITWSTAKTFDSVTQKYLDFEHPGRIISIRIESTDAKPWQLEGYDLELALLGNL